MDQIVCRTDCRLRRTQSSMKSTSPQAFQVLLCEGQCKAEYVSRSRAVASVSLSRVALPWVENKRHRRALVAPSPNSEELVGEG